MLQCVFLSTCNEKMALNIRNSKTEALAQSVAELTGETKTQAVTVALEERLKRIQCNRFDKFRIEELKEIARHCSSLPVQDNRSPDELLGYDKTGLPS